MPCYDYFCEANGQTIEVRHGMNVDLTCWGEVCYAAQVPLGDTEFDAPVRKVLSPPAIAVPIGNSKLKETGFTKLVKRDDGVGYLHRLHKLIIAVIEQTRCPSISPDS